MLSRIKAVEHRRILVRLAIDMLRTVHTHYGPKHEPFGSRLETWFVGLCVALGEMEQREFSIAKLSAYLQMPRTTVVNRLRQLESWGLIERQGKKYLLTQTGNSELALQCYRTVRRLVHRAETELTELDGWEPK